MNPSRRGIVDVWVSDHARDRARERFPGFKAARIVDEVRAAIKAGRLSANRPPGYIGEPRRDSLYAWNETGERAYPLKVCDNGLVVVTTFARNENWTPD